nr:response regulator [Pedobacter sp. SYSU D00535]
MLIVFSGVFAAYQRITELQNGNSSVDKTQEVIKFTNQVLINVTEAESSVRGYLATGKSSYLDNYNESLSKINPSLDRLTFLVQNEPGQLNLADTLSANVSQKLFALSKVLWTANSDGISAAQVELQEDVTLKRVQNVIDSIKVKESHLLAERRRSSEENAEKTIFIFYVGSGLILLLVFLLFRYIRKSFKKQKQIEERLLSTNEQLEKVSQENESQNWMLRGNSELDDVMRGDHSLEELTATVIRKICSFTTAHSGACYIYEEENERLVLAASYASHILYKKEIQLLDGLVGQAAADQKGIVVSDIPAGHILISSGSSDILPSSIVIQPFSFAGNLKGVIELCFASPVKEVQQQFISRVSDSIGIAVHTSQARVKMQRLFDHAREQALELESRHEELRLTNEELSKRTDQLQASEEELRVQQEELYQMNSDLKEQATLLVEKNQAINEARLAIARKAEELELASKYKSEFLANMSHELRTPLNSILILAKILSDNKHGRLGTDEVKYASVIHTAGSDLLNLINDILDLSKVEAGQIDLSLEEVSMRDVKHHLEALFSQLAKSKEIEFSYQIAEETPSSLVTDKSRVEQILKNLLSNAFKFTPKGGKVSVNVRPVMNRFSSAGSIELEKGVAISVKDTGIGIPDDKQELIFEAFKQADGSTSRTFGGTGLGLSICRELTALLGGKLQLQSKPGEGSEFTLFLPQTESSAPSVSPNEAAPQVEKKRTVLVIEDDVHFAAVLENLLLERGMLALHAPDGAKGMDMALTEIPDAILLDIMLPGKDGWEVLKELKAHPATNAIPVHLMSAAPGSSVKAVEAGAKGFLNKSGEIDRIEEALSFLTAGDSPAKRVLVIEDHEIQSNDLRGQFLEGNVDVEQAFTGEEALDILSQGRNFDCIILDLNLPDISGFDLLDQIKLIEEFAQTPVVVNTAMELDQSRMARIMKHTNSMVFKTNKSNNRLLQEVNLFIDKVKSGKISVTTKPEVSSPASEINDGFGLSQKSILIVDDDMRNIFALTSALQEYNINFDVAYNGREALSKLADKPDFDLVLMDIMMPEMNGYEAMQEIRKNERFRELPIIAVTAKAMKDDKEKCMDAGASDYISKPIQTDQLLGMMQSFLN